MSYDIIFVEILHPVIIISVFVLSTNFSIRGAELSWWLVLVDLIFSIVKLSQFLVYHNN